MSAVFADVRNVLAVIGAAFVVLALIALAIGAVLVTTDRAGNHRDGSPLDRLRRSSQPRHRQRGESG